MIPTTPELERVVHRLRAKILDYQNRSGTINEQNTKIALINPLLVALGWDIEELDEVSCEYRKSSQDNPVDYALLIQRVPCLFMEAKALGSNLAERRWISQTLSYAAMEGVTWCVLTDGNEYRVYNAAAPVDADEKLFRSVTLADSAQHDRVVETLQLLSKEKLSERRLSVLWEAQFIDRRVRSAFERLIGGPDDRLVKLIRLEVDGVSPADVRKSLQRADIRIHFPEVRTEDPLEPPRTPPGRKNEDPDVPSQPVSLEELITAGVIKAPLRIESTYYDMVVEGRITVEGGVEFDGAVYPSLSQAAGMARVKVKGPPPDGKKIYPTNGWTWWKARDDSTGKLVVMDEFRQRFLSQTGNPE